MEPTPSLRADPEFRPATSERSLPPIVDPGAYRRVLANPFLGILGVAAWAIAVREALVTWSQHMGLSFQILLILATSTLLFPRLFQYHCLDCGRTGRLRHWKRHVCPAVARRMVEGRPRRFRGPGPMAQMLLWGYVLAVVLVLASYAGLTSR